MPEAPPTPYLTLDDTANPALLRAQSALYEDDPAGVVAALEPFLRTLRDDLDEIERAERGTAYFMLSVAHATARRLDDSLATAELAASDFPFFPDAHLNRGWALAELGRTGEALVAYRHAVTLEPEYENAWFNFGMLLVQKGHLGDALAVLEEGIAANPESSLLGYKRAETLARAGRAGEAAEELRRVYVLDPATRKAAAGSDVFAAAFPDGLPG
ncbi:MAG: tetratricopeptide repeat protein [Deltaproteobacteria bacterium]|nr:tetratricopeptide repeat protein [Deltaproteobacteria bacterium]